MGISVDDQSRAERVDFVSLQLAVYAHRLTRLLIKAAPSGNLSLTEAGILVALLDRGPRRITELAASEGLAQPTITALIKELDAKGLVARGTDPHDQRVVLVSITERGADALAQLRAHTTETLHGFVEELSGERLDALADAIETLAGLVGGPLLESRPTSRDDQRGPAPAAAAGKHRGPAGNSATPRRAEK